MTAAGGTSASPWCGGLSLARTLGIVDGGAPLAERIAQAAARRVRRVVACAADGEPLVASERRAAERFAADLARGLSLAQQATRAERAWAAVEARATETRQALAAQAVEILTIPDVVGSPPIDDEHSLVVGAQALCALGAGTPVISRMITVAGAVAHPGVRRVAVGTTVEDLIDALGGVTCGPAWVALDGGPLHGTPLDRDDVISKRSSALFVADGGHPVIRRARLPVVEAARRARSAWEAVAGAPDQPSIQLAALRLGLGADLDDARFDSVPILPRRVAIPLQHCRGVAATPRVRPGDRVTAGTLIADLPDDALGVPLHASITGIIQEISDGAIVVSAPP